MWLPSILTLMFLSVSRESAGTPQVLTYQDGVPRAVGSSVTVVSKILDLPHLWEIVLYARNSTPESKKVLVGYLLDDGPDTNNKTDENKAVKYLRFSPSTFTNKTWTIRWNFSFLPKDYNGLILETIARAEPQATNIYSNETVLQVVECPNIIDNATAVGGLPDPCGYGCTSKFQCLPGFQVDTSVQFSDLYNCTIAADWSPALPVCSPMSETTTTEIATTHNPSAPTTSNGFAPGGDGAVHPNSGPCLAGIGGGLAAVCIGIFVYMAIIGIDIPNKVSYYAMSALCLLVWAMALGLCFGVSTNGAAVVAGIVLGSLALAGMVVIIGFQIAMIKSHKGKGIFGKAEKDPRL